ncbi:beta 1,4 Glucosyltransferase [Rickettsiales bacterium Ac37b]|nr:beta 1,4 Glucosyltransferase [Rickettsiales bacterium Ac37b]
MKIKLPISAFIIAKNEQDFIGTAIKSLVDWIDEVIVIDSGSQDKTVEIATNLGARVVYNEWSGYVNQKIFGESLCRNKWIINIDADEEFSENLKEEVFLLFSKNTLTPSAYYINVVMVHRFKKKFLCKIAPRNKVIRFYNIEIAGFCYGDLSSLYRDSVKLNKKMEVSPLELKNVIWHRSFRSIQQMMDKINFYTNIQVEEDLKKGRKINPIRVLIEFWMVFIKFYLLRRYFIYGIDGFIDSMIYAFSRFIRLAKLREKTIKNKY